MKKLFLFALVAFAISCSKEAGLDEPQTPDQPSEQPEMVTVSFAVKGDVTIEEDPLNRAAGVETESTDLYGINIYYDKEKDGEIDDVYGYGLFDNVADMTVSLLTGYKYKFVCSLVKDGKNKLKLAANSAGDGLKAYWDPFSRYDRPTPLENKFVLGTGDHLFGLGSGRSYVKGSSNLDGIHYPSGDRYYGETTDYTPKEGGVVNISLKRCAFGVKFVVTGVTDGAFAFTIEDKYGCQATQISKSGIASDTTYEGELFTYDNVYDCWQKTMAGEEFSQNFTLAMTWERGNGVTQTFDPLVVTFKRNILTTVNIRLNGGKTDNSFNLDVDSAEIGETNIDLDIDAGDMTGTPVDPTE